MIVDTVINIPLHKEKFLSGKNDFVYLMQTDGLMQQVSFCAVT